MNVTFQSNIDAALAHHRAGRLQEAEQAYRQILAQNPNDPDALHLLALLAHQVGHTQAGIELLERAVALKPDPQFFSNLAELYRTVGQFDKGIASCQRAIQAAPNLCAAHTNMAALLQAANRLPEAEASARRAVATGPQDSAANRVLGNVLFSMGRLPEAKTFLEAAVNLNNQDGPAWSNLGILLERMGRPDLAINCHFRASQLQPNSAEVLANLGHAYAVCNRHADALPCFQRAVQANPNQLDIQENLAACLEQLNRFDEAVAIAKGLIARDPNRLSYHCILGNAYLNQGNLDECEPALRRALQVSNHPDPHQILAVCLTRKGRFDEAIAEIDTAIAMRPDWAEAHFSKALILMFAGRYDEAWPHYEWRWKHPRMDSWRHVTDKPLWDGSPLDGKTIFLYAEQGLGDTIYFARYATLVAERGGNVILEVQPGMRELMQSVPKVTQVIVRGDKVPPFDTHAPLLSLPGIFKTSLETIPAKVPYITPPADKVEQWKKIIGDAAGKLKVGIGWEGGAFQRENHLRSTTLAAFAPLAAIPNVRFYSLQKGPAAGQAQRPPAGMDLVNLDAHIKDFSDTAAAVANMDLVISIDTSIIHVAGAMARPCWTLLGLHLGHMWLSGRDDTPWYPTMRLFRQPKLGQWAPVMDRVAAELAQYVQVAGLNKLIG
jgi:tetratricopeptide (TPR) repeat protein